MNLQRHRIAGLLAVLALALVGCTPAEAPGTPGAPATPEPGAPATPAGPGTPGAGTPAPGDGELNIVFLPKQVNNPYFDAAAEGGQRAADELGGQFEQVGPSEATSDAQVPYIQDLTTQGVDAIVISATDPDAIAPALQAARDADISVVGYDSPPAAGAYDVFVNQTDFSLIGGAMADWACQLAPDCSGEIAILSATATAPNQNAWIEDMQSVLEEDERFANLELVDIVYGDDDPQTSTTQAQGLLTSYPDLRVIVAPTTVGILAAAQVVSQSQPSEVKVTGLGLPNDMREFVAEDGVTPIFGLWAVPDLGYLAYQVAAKLISGELTGAPGETFSIPAFEGRYEHNGEYTIGEDSIVILGPPFEFTPENIDEFDF